LILEFSILDYAVLFVAFFCNLFSIPPSTPPPLSKIELLISQSTEIDVWLASHSQPVKRRIALVSIIWKIELFLSMPKSE